MDSLSQFSKRKYLKKQPKQESVEQICQEEPTVYAGTELNSKDYILEQIPEIDVEKAIDYYSTDSLAYNDTIITKSGEVIVCKISSISGPTIFYHFDPKSEKKVRKHIPIANVKYCAKNGIDYTT